jgi:hypothetical protein
MEISGTHAAPDRPGQRSKQLQLQDDAVAWARWCVLQQGIFASEPWDGCGARRVRSWPAVGSIRRAANSSVRDPRGPSDRPTTVNRLGSGIELQKCSLPRVSFSHDLPGGYVESRADSLQRGIEGSGRNCGPRDRSNLASYVHRCARTTRLDSTSPGYDTQGGGLTGTAVLFGY